MKLAFSSNAFKKTDVLTAIGEVGRIGYAGIEIMADVPHCLPAQMGGDDVAAVKECIAKTGVGVSNVNAFTFFGAGDERDGTYHPSFIDPVEKNRSLRIEHTIQSLKFASAVGARTMSVEPGGPLPEGMSRDEAYRLFAAGLSEALPCAARYGVKMIIEPEPELLIERSEEMEEFFSILSDPYLGLNFDIGHFYCVGEDVPAAIKLWGDRIDHFHIEDIASDRTHRHLVPGDGAIDFDSIFEAISGIGYDGWVTVELYPYVETASEAARKAFRRLKHYFGESA